MKDRFPNNYLHASHALTLYIVYAKHKLCLACGFILFKTVTIATLSATLYAFQFNFTYFRPAHAGAEDKHSLE